MDFLNHKVWVATLFGSIHIPISLLKFLALSFEVSCQPLDLRYVIDGEQKSDAEYQQYPQYPQYESLVGREEVRRCVYDNRILWQLLVVELELVELLLVKAVFIRYNDEVLVLHGQIVGCYIRKFLSLRTVFGDVSSYCPVSQSS